MAISANAFNLALLDALGIDRSEMVSEILISARANDIPRIIVYRHVTDEQTGKLTRLLSCYELIERPAVPSEQETPQ